MKQIKSTYLLLLLAVFSLVSGPTAIGFSQDNDFGFGQTQEPGKQDPLADPLQDPLKNPLAGFGSQNSEPRADFESKFVVQNGKNKGMLLITGKPDFLSHSHIYSQRTDLEHHKPTIFTVIESADFKVGKFVPDIQPENVKKDVNGVIWETEEFSTDVTWSAPIEFAENIDVKKLEIKTRIEGQVCNEGGCLPYVDLFVTAKFDGFLKAGPYRSSKPLDSDKVEWLGKVSATTVKAGETFTVSFTAKVDEKWHIYGTPLMKGQKGYSPTIIAFTNKGELTHGPTKPSVEPIEKDMKKYVQLHHEGEVTFSTEFSVPEDSPNGPIMVAGKLGFQTCNEKGICKKPSAADFQFEIRVSAEAEKMEQPILISDSSSDYDAILKIAQKVDKKKTKKGKEPFVLSTFLWYCGLSFLAGLILNVMPCVLPVIGLKMMSFIEQAGENRGRIFALNLSFSLGLMSVFWLLGFLVVIMDFGWGDLLNKGLTGVIIASGIVFAFGLSMMGVWEIPIPGFASSSHASKMAEKEGLGGAFVKGILTTVLATPCVGPMLIPAMTFAVSQSPFVGFAIFTVLGIGMAFPFLLVAVFPQAIRLLPKPGAWMDTFKQIMGFVLIGTVLFLLSTFAKPSEQNTPYVLPVMFMLLVIGIGCWWIGRTSIAAEFKDKAKAYIIGAGIIAGGTWGGFYVLGPSDYELDWQPYSNTLLADLREEGKPIFIDFTGPG